MPWCAWSRMNRELLEVGARGDAVDATQADRRIPRHEDHQCGAERIHRARTGQRADPEGLEDRVRRRLEFREQSELVGADGADGADR